MMLPCALKLVETIRHEEVSRVAGRKTIVILWCEEEKRFYRVLEETGEIARSAPVKHRGEAPLFPDAPHR